MARRARGLSAAKVAKAKPGRYGDGGGLYLFVRPGPRRDDGEAAADAKFWTFRWVRDGRMREAGLGPASGRAAVSLKAARERAAEFRGLLWRGLDPIETRKAARIEAALIAAKAVSFKDCAERYIEAHRAGWRNAKHAKQWEATLATYAAPVIGKLPVQAIDTALVSKVLEPIWTEKPETASRLRGRIESILDWARVRGFRTGENPARWRGHLDNLLPSRAKVRRVEHHAALPYAEVGAFMVALREQDGIAARALEFAILTAARTGEAIGARWREIDMAEKAWTVPGSRMKTGKEHRAPLSPRAIEILKEMLKLAGRDAPGDGYVFGGAKPGAPLSNMALMMLLRRMGRGELTVHGFRSTFRDWCAERTSYPSEVAEMALAHAVGDKVEAAYRRGDLFEKRRGLAKEWARFCAAPAAKPGGGTVVAIGVAGKGEPKRQK